MQEAQHVKLVIQENTMCSEVFCWALKTQPNLQKNNKQSVTCLLCFLMRVTINGLFKKLLNKC